jgi:hypothetical protein
MRLHDIAYNSAWGQGRGITRADSRRLPTARRVPWISTRLHRFTPQKIFILIVTTVTPRSLSFGISYRCFLRIYFYSIRATCAVHYLILLDLSFLCCWYGNVERVAILAGAPDIMTEGFRSFLKSLRANSGTFPRTNHDHFFRNPFQFINHPTIKH